MNTSELLESSHLLILQAVDDLPETQWDLPGACGDWSIKDTMAHFASYEQVLLAVLEAVQRGEKPHTDITQIHNHAHEFNRQEVEKRQYQTAQQVLNEYNDAQIQVGSLASMIPQEQLTQTGTLPWLHSDISLADLLQGFAEHANKHAQQIMQFRKQHEQSDSE